MTNRVTYLLSKDPVTEHGGDLALARLMMGIARESFNVDCICLSSDPNRRDDGVTRVAKPQVDKRSILARSLRTGRSLVHTRFDVDAFVRAIDDSDSTTFVTEHSYVAESYLRSAKPRSGARLLVSTDVSESLVWKATRGLIGRFESPRIRRDELRVAKSADSVGTYDRGEVDYYRQLGVNATWLDITLPPRPRVDITDSAPRLVFFGDRTWSPNDEACDLLLRWWPAIAHGIDGAELCLAGKPAPGKASQKHPDGVHELGFVDDLDALLGSCRALAAPIRTGGGVRVKILESMSIGLPVVSTTTGLGSLAAIFNSATLDDKEVFVARCRELLLDRTTAVAEGERVWTINAERWSARRPHATIENWLRG